jgi:hypothetical protein
VAVAISFYKIASILKYSKAVMLEGDVRLATWTDEVIGTSLESTLERSGREHQS